MTSKQCILSIGFSVALLLATVNVSDAQPRGGPPGGAARPGVGGGGAGRVGGSPNVYAPYRGVYGANVYSPYRGGYNSPGISIGIGVGGIGYGAGYGIGAIFPYSAFPAYSPGYYPADPYYASPYVAPRYSYLPPAGMAAPGGPEPPLAAQEPPAQPNGTAQIRVLVPDGNAKVWFDGAATKQTGTDRYFHTPVLTPGSSNTYRIRAAWTEEGEEMVQERVVTVGPGATALADFR